KSGGEGRIVAFAEVVAKVLCVGGGGDEVRPGVGFHVHVRSGIAGEITTACADQQVVDGRAFLVAVAGVEVFGGGARLANHHRGAVIEGGEVFGVGEHAAHSAAS